MKQRKLSWILTILAVAFCTLIILNLDELRSELTINPDTQTTDYGITITGYNTAGNVKNNNSFPVTIEQFRGTDRQQSLAAEFTLEPGGVKEELYVTMSSIFIITYRVNGEEKKQTLYPRLSI